MGGCWGLFQKAAKQILPSPVERPQTRNSGHGKGREDLSCEGDSPLGVSWDEFQGHAAVLWNGVGLCGFLKQAPMASKPVFQSAKFIRDILFFVHHSSGITGSYVIKLPAI